MPISINTQNPENARRGLTQQIYEMPGWDAYLDLGSEKSYVDGRLTADQLRAIADAMDKLKTSSFGN